MVFKNVGIAITERCNAKCQMCCSSCGTLDQIGLTMTSYQLQSLLGQIRDVPFIEEIGITGGEPMLFPDLVRQVLDFDFGREMRVGIKTNGFWGENKKRASEFLEEYAAKLDSLSFSYDEFHRDYISLNAIKNLIELAWERKIPTEVVGCFVAGSVTPGEIMDEFGDSIYKTRFKYQPVFRTGLASDFPEDSFISLYSPDQEDLPCMAGRQGSLLVTTAMDLYPCCSQVVQNTILKIGNLKEQSLSDAIETALGNRLIVELITEGLAPFVKALEGKLELSQGITIPCELCGSIFEDGRYLGAMDEYLRSRSS